MFSHAFSNQAARRLNERSGVLSNSPKLLHGKSFPIQKIGKWEIFTEAFGQTTVLIEFCCVVPFTQFCLVSFSEFSTFVVFLRKKITGLLPRGILLPNVVLAFTNFPNESYMLDETLCN